MSASASLFGTQAVAGGGFAGSLNLTSNVVFGGVVAPTIYLPLASSRLNANGQAQKAGGSTAALLNYTNIVGEWWTDTGNGDGSLYEVYFDTVTNEPANSGAATWFGAGALNSWQALTTDKAWTLQKNTTSFGVVSWPVLMEIREIANPANTTGPQLFTHVVSVDF